MDDRSNCMEYIRACEKAYLEDLIALCPDGVIAIDRSGCITLFNRTAELLTGFSAEEAVGKMNITQIYMSEAVAREIKQCIYADTLGGPGCVKDYETEVENRDGRCIPIRLSATLIYKNGQEVGSVGFFHDQTARKKMEEKLRYLSITDSLTGLYNQRYFHTCLSREMDRIARYGRSLSLICFDLDNFKQCNDVLGHLEGDNVLRLIGKLLSESIRRSDMAFRYGGDEFFVLLPETPLKQAATTAEKLQKGFSGRWPYDTSAGGGGTKPVTLSLGVTEAIAGDTPESLIKRADLAMYAAKRNGGNRVNALAENSASA